MFKRLFATKSNPYIPGRYKRERLEFDLSGSILQLDLPPHSAELKEKCYRGFNINIHTDPNYQCTRNPPPEIAYQEGTPDWLNIYRRAFGITGGLFSKSFSSFAVCYVSVVRFHTMPASMTCFNPAHLEQAVNNFMYYSSGPGAGSYNIHFCPTAWQVEQMNGVTYVVYDSVKPAKQFLVTGEMRTLNREIIIPIDDNIIVNISFENTGYGRDCPNSFPVISDFINELIPNVNIQYSTAIQSKINAAKQKWPNAPISKQREVEDWMYHSNRQGNPDKDEPKEIYTLDGTPLPIFKLEDA